MKKMKKLFCLLLVVSMMFSLIACGNKKESAESDTTSNEGSKNTTDTSDTADTNEDTSEPAETAIDTSERADLVFYVMGDAPTDEQVVEDAINEILLEKINATVDFQFSTWTDWSQKYNLELTSGAADLIYVANWINYATLSNSGAFLELDDLISTYAPNVVSTYDQSLLDQLKVNGTLYGIPNSWPEYTVSGISYREDLRVKYNLPVPNSIENLEAYLLGIKQNDPAQGLLSTTTGESTGLQVAFDAANILNLKYSWVTPNGLPYGLGANYDTPSEVYDYWNSDDFAEDMKLMKKFADEGFWSRSALSDTNDSEAYNNGVCVAVVAGQNPNKNITAITNYAKDHPEWQSEYIAYGEVNGVIFPAHATQNATAVVRGSKNPERALMALDLMLTDKDLNDLVQYGIKGTHYDVDASGVYQNLSENFKYEGLNTWNLRNGDYKLPQASDTILNEMFAKYEELGNKTKFPNVNVFGGFAEDYSSYEVERSSVSDVMRQYLAPLQAGLVDDVDAAVKEFREKVADAGLATCQEEFKKQWAAYCESHAYK
ncbi:MAG: extracellular solute-binding protein [Herbinix sp.]|jgi:putative aldouronate transport system substrate-binding protein|nr:extracellular solute-binding protein [Herbinix sp.]